MVNILSIIQRRKYSTGKSDDIGSELLYIFFLHIKSGEYSQGQSQKEGFM